MVLPDGMTKETNHSSARAAGSRWADITGAVIAIFSDALLPWEMYLKREPKAALEAVA
jgi:hypothetical protein